AAGNSAIEVTDWAQSNPGGAGQETASLSGPGALLPDLLSGSDILSELGVPFEELQIPEDPSSTGDESGAGTEAEAGTEAVMFGGVIEAVSVAPTTAPEELDTAAQEPTPGPAETVAESGVWVAELPAPTAAAANEEPAAVPAEGETLASWLVETLRAGNAPPATTGHDPFSELFGNQQLDVSQSLMARSEPIASRSLGLHETTVSGAVAADVTWSGTVRISTDLIIGAGVTVTVQPGTVIKVGRGAYIQVDGTLNAQGTATEPIVMTSVADDSVGEDLSGEGVSTGRAGDWQQVFFQAGSGGSVLRHFELRFAGMTNPGNNDFREAVTIQGGSTVRLEDVRVRDVSSHGIRVLDSNPILRRVDVQRAGPNNGRGVPFYFNLAARPVLDGLTASENGREGIWIDGGTLSAPLTLDFVGMPYLFTVDLAVDAPLTVGPGVVIKMNPGDYLWLRAPTQFLGTAEAPIVITSIRDDTVGGDTQNNGSGDNAPRVGDWQQVIFDAASGASVMRHTEIRYAGMTNPGNNDPRDAILIQAGATTTLEDVRIRDVFHNAVRVLDSNPTLRRVDVQRAGPGRGAVPFYFNLASRPVLQGLSSSGNGSEGIWIDGGVLAAPLTLDYVGMPYLFTVDLTVDAPLTVGPGVVLKMNPGDYLWLRAPSQFLGTTTAPIVITAIKDDTVGGDTQHNGSEEGTAPAVGDWQQIIFEGSSGASVMRHTEIRYAGMTNPRNNDARDTILIQGGATTTLEDVRIRDVFHQGVRVLDSNPTLRRVDVQRAGPARGAVPFYFNLASRPVLEGLTSSGNGNEGLWIDGGILAAPLALDYVGMPYLFTNNLTVDAALTIGPGVVLKMNPGDFLWFRVPVQVKGTVEAPVIVTSIKDDSVSGDTQHNGAEDAAAPRPGDWESVYFAAGSVGSVVEGLEVRYAGMTGPGNNDYRPAVELGAGAEVTLRNLRIRDVARVGLRMESLKSVLENVDVQRAGNAPYSFTLAADPVMSGLTASNNGVEGLWIQGGTLTADRTWSLTTVPIVLPENVTVGADATLKLGAGVVLK
ncbi:MAG: right-handed parallel beta-helix repeat-containing protein, partial [Verrucomicrobiales bacterium]|nr:right-handed parallel beta-helix repeat-containing protein [Verrucomicrobiales bacterium]